MGDGREVHQSSVRRSLLVLVLGASLLLGPAAAAGRPLPTLAHACGVNVTATALHLRTPDRVTLYAAVLGSGRVGVVLAPQHYGTSCEWVPEAKLLAAHGYRVLVFDYRGAGNSDGAASQAGAARIDLDVVAAARELRRRGLTRIVLVGSLIGSIAALDAATAVDTPVSAVVALAPPNIVDEGALMLTRAAKALQVPILVLAGDVSAVSRGESQMVYDALSSHEKHVLAVPPAVRGVDVVRRKAANAAVLNFIAAHTR
jgi:dienelactone hydrolase